MVINTPSLFISSIYARHKHWSNCKYINVISIVFAWQKLLCSWTSIFPGWLHCRLVLDGADYKVTTQTINTVFNQNSASVSFMHYEKVGLCEEMSHGRCLQNELLAIILAMWNMTILWWACHYILPLICITYIILPVIFWFRSILTVVSMCNIQNGR